MREQAPAALLPHDLGDSSSGSAASAASFAFDPKRTLSRPLTSEHDRHRQVRGIGYSLDADLYN